MKRTLISFFALTAGATAALALTPVTTPTNLSAEITGHQVRLAWENPDADKIIAENNFEGEWPGEGWEVKTTNTFMYCNSWWQYPDEKFMKLQNWQRFIGEGERSANVFYDLFAPHPDNTSAVQDEWLISPDLPNAAYVSFVAYINPTVLEYGQYEEFKEHYMVMMTEDEGKTWTTLWDARYDSDGTDGWQPVCLALGNETDHRRIAFVAQSDPEDADLGLHFAFGIDNVRFFSTKPVLSALPPRTNETAPATDDFRPLTKELKTRIKNLDARKHAIAKFPVSESYNVYYDGECIASRLRACNYTDNAPKTPGEHTYEVRAVNGPHESESATITVNLADLKFLPPANVKATLNWNPDVDDWDVVLSWDDPETDFLPSSYKAYCDGVLYAENIKDHSVAQWGNPKGVFIYGLSAVYSHPDGESEIVTVPVAIDTRQNVTNVTAKVTRNDVMVSWKAPLGWENERKGTYTVYRGNTLLAEGLEREYFLDTNVPGALHTYNVIAIYNDGFEALPRQTIIQAGASTPMAIPYAERFDGRFCPTDWEVVPLDEETVEAYNWCFNNQYGIDLTGGEGFEGGFASIDCEHTGFVFVCSALASPAIDCTNCDPDAPLYVSMDADFMSVNSGDSQAFLEYSIDDGETWEEIHFFVPYLPVELMEGETCLPEHLAVQINEFAAGNIIRFAIVYSGDFDRHLAIDNFAVSSTPASVALTGSDAAEITSRRFFRADGIEVNGIIDGEPMVILSKTADGKMHIDKIIRKK